VALALALAASPSLACAAGCGAAAGLVQPVSVGERGEVALADKRVVRFAGLDVPEQGAQGAAARDFIASHALSRAAALVVFAPAGDRWGRTLADLSAPQGAGQPVSLADALLAAGLARVRPEFETRACEPQRLALEAGARAKKLGVWGDPDYSVLAANDGAELAQREGRFVVVEGVVSKVGLGRSRFYLDLGRRGDLSVTASRKTEAAFQAAGAPLSALAGERIRVRGVLDDRFGPQIEIADPLMLERLGRAEAKRGIEPGG
jgi:endonuclease YncB( thermonuclease family)